MPIVLMLQVSAVIIIFALLIILLLFLQPGSNKIEAQKNRAKAKNTYDNICILLYNTINKIYMVNNFIQSIYNMYKSIYIIKEEKAKQKTGNFIIVEILTIILSVSISLIYFKDLLITTAVTLIISTLVYQKLIGDGSIFLSCLNETISDIVHIYNAEGGNIDRMFLKLLKNEDYITPYLEQMYIYLKKAILSKDATYINEYIRISPSRYLRLIFNCIYMTMKFGDDTDNNNIKLFNKNMMAIQREINSEEVKIQKIKDAVFMEIFFIIMPIFILPIADWYMREFFVFDFVQNFLNGSIGYIVKISAVIVSYLCFYIYNKLIRINLPLEASGKIPWVTKL